MRISFVAIRLHRQLHPLAARTGGGDGYRRPENGRRFAPSGLIDSFQYLGAQHRLSKGLGWFLDRSWDYYFYYMAPFGVIGGLLMWKIAHRPQPEKRGA